MSTRYLISLLFGMLCTASAVQAQQLDARFDISVSAGTVSLQGQTIDVVHSDYGVGYGEIRLDASGNAQVDVYPGPHAITVAIPGFAPQTQSATAVSGETVAVSFSLSEDVQTPHALTADYTFNPYTALSEVYLSWNMEPDIFFDDFESYEPFAIEFGEWTGIDADRDAAAQIEGSYPHRGELQYAQVMNPLEVDPQWWYDYPVLRPLSGVQYVGFVRTNSGVANNDWLITPVVTPGRNNVFEFFAKAADVYNEKFQVYITTVTENPAMSDFVKLGDENYETASYEAWRRMVYDLSVYEGVPVKLAIRYMSNANAGGAFMLMIDDVRVGQQTVPFMASRRVATQSPANPYEKFEITLDGVAVATVNGYTCVIPDVERGEHIIGVQAVYTDSRSEQVTLNLDIPAQGYCNYTATLLWPSDLSMPSGTLTLIDLETAREIRAEISGEKPVNIPYLPYGDYSLEIDCRDAYSPYSENLTINQETLSAEYQLCEPFAVPVNVSTATDSETGNVRVVWNRYRTVQDSFEDYPDFAVDSFGDWLSLDLDGNIVYPIQLGEYIINFPGASLPQTPTAIPPIVFNASKTVPSMLPTDQAMTAPSGDKQILFFSPQGMGANKWLISPPIDLMDGDLLRVTAKSYNDMYAETLEFHITDDLSGNPESMVLLSTAERMPSSEWMMYETDLSEFAGNTVRIGIHYTTIDGFFAQLDDFYVGSGEENEQINVGNVLRYDVYLDDKLYVQTQDTEVVFEGLEPGDHTVSIVAIYATGESEPATVNISVSGIDSVIVHNEESAEWFTPSGFRIAEPQTSGIYIIRQGGCTKKVIRR